MDFSALGGCLQSIHEVPRRSSVSSEHSSKVRFSGSFIFLEGARLFYLGMLALILTLPWNPPSTYAWSFSNDSIPAPPTVVGLDAPSVSPPALPSEVPPSPSLVLISPTLPSGSPPPISQANPPSPSTGTPGPTPTAEKRKRLNLVTAVGIVVIVIVVVCLPVLLYRRLVPQRPLHIFISHARVSVGSGENFSRCLYIKMTSWRWSNQRFRVKIFFDVSDFQLGVIFARKILEELERSDLGLVVVSKDYFERKWPMMELIAFMEAQRNDPRNRICIIPVFYELTRYALKDHLIGGTWEHIWTEMAKGPHPIEVEKCREAVNWLCNLRGLSYASHSRNHDKLYIDKVCKDVDKILCDERSFASNLRWAKTTVLKRVTAMTCIDTEKRRRRANQRAGKKIGLMIYIDKRLQLLFALSGLLNILLSVILDNSFNDKPVRFTAVAILSPVTIFWGFLASGWFPRIPLRFIAFVKRRGFLQQVVPCSPWHDNVVTDYCGEICTLEPLEQDEGTRLFELPMSVQTFLYGDRLSPQGTTATATTHSTFDSKIQDFHEATSVQEGQDLQELTTGCEMFDFAPLSEILKRSHSEMATGQVSSPNLQEPPSQVGDIVVDIDRSSVFHILGDERAPILEFDGPEINGFLLSVQAFKNTSTKDHTFDLSCTFRNKRTKRMYLTTERLQNLVQNMCQWVKNPYPIVVDESSDILHCMAIEDILWEFTKTVYTFRPVRVEHRFLAGLGHVRLVIIWSFVCVSFALGLIPLIFDQKSLFFLFFLLVPVPYLIALKKTNALTFYFIRSLFCPICVKIYGFNRLYKSRSPFRWCNEFRKERIVNPTHFWIDEEYANTFPDRASCFDVCGFLQFSSPPKSQSFTMSCQGWLIQDPGHPPGHQLKCKKQHEYKLRVQFDSVKLIKGVNCYINVRLAFFENNHLLGDFNYSAIEVQKIDFIEQLFHCFSNPSFGGYVEEICPRGYCSTTFVAHCPRFIDICHKICCSNSIPKLLVGSRMPDSKFIVGVPFWSSEL